LAESLVVEEPFARTFDPPLVEVFALFVVRREIMEKISLLLVLVLSPRMVRSASGHRPLPRPDGFRRGWSAIPASLAVDCPYFFTSPLGDEGCSCYTAC